MPDHPTSVTLRYFALLREQRGLSEEKMLTTASTARALYEEIARRYRFTLPATKIGVAINDQFCTLDHHLHEGDQIVFIPPVAGG